MGSEDMVRSMSITRAFSSVPQVFRKSGGGTAPKLTGWRAVIQRHLDSACCNFVLAALLSFMVVLLIVDTNYGAHGTPAPWWVKSSSTALLVIYACEVMLRVVVYGARFRNEVYVVIDLIAIVIDLTLLLAEVALGFETDMPVMLLRLARVMRITRAVRFMTMFPALKLLLRGIAYSTMAIFWGVFLLAFILLFWSILSVVLIHPLNVELTQIGYWEAEGCERCPRAFESVQESMLTYMQQILAGDSWGQLTIPIVERFPASAILFLAVFVSLSLGAMNLLLAVIVESASDAKRMNLEQEAQLREAEYNEARVHLQHLFAELDEDGNGVISKAELIEGSCSNAHFASLLKIMDIKRDDLEVLYDMMDIDGSGQVEYQEFVEQLYKIKKCEASTMLVFIHFYVTEIQQMLQAATCQGKASRRSRTMRCIPRTSGLSEDTSEAGDGMEETQKAHVPAAFEDLDSAKAALDNLVRRQIEGLETIQRTFVESLDAREASMSMPPPDTDISRGDVPLPCKDMPGAAVPLPGGDHPRGKCTCCLPTSPREACVRIDNDGAVGEGLRPEAPGMRPDAWTPAESYDEACECQPSVAEKWQSAWAREHRLI